MSDIEGLSIKDLKSWYQAWYQPSNAVLVVVGDVKVDEVYKLAIQYFGMIESRDVLLMQSRKAFHIYGNRRVEVRLPVKVPKLFVGYNVPSVHTAELDWEPFALKVLTAILDGGESSRFAKELIREREIAISADVLYTPYVRHDTLFLLSGIPSNGKTLKDLEFAFFEEIHKLQTELVEVVELESAKLKVTANGIYDEHSMRYQAFEISALEASGYQWQDVDIFTEKIQQITAKQIKVAARKYLFSDCLTVMYLIPTEQ